MMNNDKRNFYLLLIISFFACLALGWYAYHQYEVIETKTQQIAAITDTVRLYRTKSGASGAERRVFVGTKDDALTLLKATDPKAYQIVKQTAGLHFYADYTTKTRIDTVTKIDSVIMYRDSTGKMTYSMMKDIKEPKDWYNAKVEIKDDSLSLKVEMNDKYHVITHDKSNGLFKPKSYVINVENENPYVHITGLQSFEIQPKNRQLGLKIGGVAIVGIGAFLLLHR